jgi:hypothetical protein
MLRRSMLLAGLLLLTLGVLPAQAQTNAQLRLIIAIADVPSVDVYWNGHQKVQNFDFASISVHLTVPAGTGKVAVAPVGQGLNAAFASSMIDVAAGRTYTLAIIGQRAETNFQLYEDMLTAPPPGAARMRVIHAAPSHGPIAIRIARGATLVEAVSFPQSSDYRELAGGRYQLQITPASGRELLATQRDWRLLAGTIHDLVMLDQGKGLQVELDTYTPIRLLPATGLLPRQIVLVGGIALLLLVAGSVLRRGRVPAD